MNRTIAEKVYDTLCGVGDRDEWTGGVENLFAPGSVCRKEYDRMLDAYDRLCTRLGVQDEDTDVEIIINCLLNMEYRISRAMYEYGARFAER